MTVTTPSRGPEIEQDPDLDRRVAELEALIEEARRRARRRRMRIAAVIAVAVAAGVAGLIGFGGRGGGGAGTAALADDSGPAGRAKAPSLAALPAGDRPSVFAFDRPNVVYVASAHARDGVFVHKTTDGGRHWQPTGARGTGWISDDLSLTVDPQHPGTLYAGTDTAVYKTVDGGRTWRPFNQGLFPPHGGQRVCFRPVGQGPYCVKLPFGTPGTTSWNRNNGWVIGVAVDPSDGSIVYSATDAVRKSTDGGHTWKTVLQLYPPHRHGFTRVAIASTRPESIYAITHTNTGRTAIYKSTDAGRTWRATGGRSSVFPNSADGDSTDALAVDAQHPRTVYAAVGHALLKTTDAGANWQPIANGLPAGVTSLAADPRRSGTLYAGLQTGDGTGAIYQTTDGGRTWKAAQSGPAIATLAVDPARPATIWAAGWVRAKRTQQYKPFMIRSTDRGRTWATAP